MLMSKTPDIEPTIDPVIAPGLFALLAADMAEFLIKVPDTTGTAGPQPTDTDFVLDFEIEPVSQTGLQLRLEHDSEGQIFTVTARAAQITDLNAVGLRALRMNHHLPEPLRFSIDENEQSCLVLTQHISAPGLTLDRLADSVREVSQIMQLTMASELYADVSTDTSLGVAAMNPSMLRG